MNYYKSLHMSTKQEPPYVNQYVIPPRISIKHKPPGVNEVCPWELHQPQYTDNTKINCVQFKH